MGYIHVEIDVVQTPKKTGGVCGDAVTYFRTPEATVSQLSGLGLGLYIVSEIVAAHGGTIGVTSAAAGGARFEISLPVAGGARATGEGPA